MALNFQSIRFSLFLKELFLFGFTQLIGLFSAFRLSKTIAILTPPNFDLSSFFIFIIIFVFFIYLAYRFSNKAGVFYKIILAMIIFSGSQTIFSLILPITISTVLGILLSYLALTKKIVLIHNIAISLSIAGISSIFGLTIKPISAIIILIVLSFYDIIAVYKTKHMVKMAQHMIQAGAIFGIVLPLKVGGWFENLKNVQPGEQFMILGSGDIAMPLILISSAAANFGLGAGVVVMLFSFIGLFLTHLLFVLQKERRPMAALPPIATMTIIGYLVSLVL